VTVDITTPDKEVVRRLVGIVTEAVVVDDVVVHDGVVELRGTVEYPMDVPVVEGAVRSVPGVVAVHARMSARQPDPTLARTVQP
jgi:hypothetical protein